MALAIWLLRIFFRGIPFPTCRCGRRALYTGFPRRGESESPCHMRIPAVLCRLCRALQHGAQLRRRPGRGGGIRCGNLSK
ncbi:MAG: hypothetical protein AB7U46_08185 [Paenirhodobacter sp.]